MLKAMELALAPGILEVTEASGKHSRKWRVRPPAYTRRAALVIGVRSPRAAERSVAHAEDGPPVDSQIAGPTE